MLPYGERVKDAGLLVLISDKIHFKTKLFREQKEGHFMLIKGVIHQEKKIIFNLYGPNIGAPNFIQQALLYLKTQIHANTVIVGDFNTPLSPIDRSSRQKKKSTKKH
jgi:hypothetical protein